MRRSSEAGRDRRACLSHRRGRLIERVLIGFLVGGTLTVGACSAASTLIPPPPHINTYTPTIPMGIGLDPLGRFVYTANWVNTLSQFTISATGASLDPPGGVSYVAGTYPQAVAATPNGEYVYVADSLSNSVSAFSVDSVTGSLSQVSGSPFTSGGLNGPFTLGVTPDGSFLYVVNRGNVGVMGGWGISAYRISSGGGLTLVNGSPFTGGMQASSSLLMPQPESIAISPTSDLLYVGEANIGGGVAAYTYDPTTGVLTAVSGSPFAVAGTGVTSVLVDPTGGYLYATDPSLPGIDAYSIDPTVGTLSALSGSPFETGGLYYPQSLVIAQTTSGSEFMYVTNPVAGSISAFSVNSSGALTALNGPAYSPADGLSPGPIVFDSKNGCLYGIDTGAGVVVAYTVGQSSGALSEIPGSPFAVN